jgi:geranylgeranyl pyrophosphate synthase
MAAPAEETWIGMTPSCSTTEIRALLTDLAERTDAALDRWIAAADVPPELAEAMRYAALGGGKRLRPAMLILAARAAAGGKEPSTDPLPAAVAIELVHCYSLVHDDLPARDDDDLRRGRPTVHVKYGEAMAILVGDALLTQAFAIVAEQVRPASVAAALVAELARGAGPAGMIAGQVADMALCQVPPGREGLDYIPARKTAAMFASAARMGGLCAAAGAESVDALGRFAEDLGLAFQIKDDVLDATATSDQLGKTAGKDARSGKRTYPSVVGMEPSAAAAGELSRRALEHLDCFGAAGAPLRELAGLLLERQS